MVAMTIALAITGATLATAGIGTFAIAFVISMAISMAVSMVLNEILSPSQSSGQVDNGNYKDPGVDSRLRINTDNRIGVGYGTFWIKGAEVYGQASNNFKEAYYAIALVEAITGHPNAMLKVYWEEYELTLGGDGWVTTAKDAAGNTVSDFNNNVRVQFFANGLPYDRSSLPNITWFQTSSNALTSYSCAVITIKYNRDKQIFALKDMTFCLRNDLNVPGDVIQDYMTNTLYGCALPLAMVDTDSLAQLNTFSNQILPSTTSTGALVNAPRYRLDGIVNTNQNCWKNLEDLLFSCGCYARVNNQTGQYGAYIDKATDVIAFAFDDTTINGQSQLVTAEFASVPNEVEVKFPRFTLPTDGSPDLKFKGQQDTFNLAIPASVLPANSQPNQYVLEYRYVANDVQAKRLASIDLNNNALDLSYTFRTNFKAIGIVSGDVVTITSKYNGWLNKTFRVISMAEIEDQTTGNITLEFFVKEYDAAVYNDSTVVQYPPAANVNGPSPRYEQSFVPAAPQITGVDLTIPVPSLSLTCTIPAGKVEDQIDFYYLFNTTDTNKAVFMFSIYGSLADGSIGTGSFTYPVLGNGGKYAPQVVIPGNYRFVVKYYNDALGTAFSEVSSEIQWRPTTQQWQEQFAMFRWADDAAGTNMTTNPDNKRWMGVYNSFNPVSPSDPTLYTWFDLGSVITRNNQLFFRIYQNRVLSYRLANANPDSTLWTNAYNFPDPVNPAFNLDETTGFYVKTAYQSAGNNYLTSVWNADGSITYLLPKGTSVPGTTPITAIGAITVDNEGRVTGYLQNDQVYVTLEYWTASPTYTSASAVAGIGIAGVAIAGMASQTFTFNHIVGQALFFVNGMLLDPADYSENATSFTVNNIQAGSAVMAASFRMTSPSGEVVPFIRTDIPTVQGQTDYTLDLNEGCEMVFLNGSSFASVDYDTPVDNILRLNVAPSRSGQNLTVVNFRPLNGVASPFTEALGSTVGSSSVVEMNGTVNAACVITAMNGSTLLADDYVPSLYRITLTEPAVFTGDVVQADSFVSSGVAEDPLPAFPEEQPTFGDIITSLQSRIETLENQA